MDFNFGQTYLINLFSKNYKQSNISKMLTILIFLLKTVTILCNPSCVSMKIAIFPLGIKKWIFICINSTSKAMWLIIFVDYASLIVIKLRSFYVNVNKLLEIAITWIKWSWIFLIFTICIFNYYRSLLTKFYFW